MSTLEEAQRRLRDYVHGNTPLAEEFDARVEQYFAHVALYAAYNNVLSAEEREQMRLRLIAIARNFTPDVYSTPQQRAGMALAAKRLQSGELLDETRIAADYKASLYGVRPGAMPQERKHYLQLRKRTEEQMDAATDEAAQWRWERFRARNKQKRLGSRRRSSRIPKIHIGAKGGKYYMKKGKRVYIRP